MGIVSFINESLKDVYLTLPGDGYFTHVVEKKGEKALIINQHPSDPLRLMVTFWYTPDSSYVVGKQNSPSTSSDETVDLFFADLVFRKRVPWERLELKLVSDSTVERISIGQDGTATSNQLLEGKYNLEFCVKGYEKLFN